MRTFLIRLRLRFAGFSTWPSWTGFGVTLDWPQKDPKPQEKEIKALLARLLPKDWVVEGPKGAAGGALVIYAWPKNDPDLQREMQKAKNI
ncbi:MAG: hypothetical protein Q7R83_02265 [bacterium]|nr:hypothetical protein [bacterium]